MALTKKMLDEIESAWLKGPRSSTLEKAIAEAEIIHNEWNDHCHLKSKYGMSLEEFEARSSRQGGKCLICRKPPKGRRLVVDHCHKTKRVRGLLCQRCNIGIGQFGDDPKLILRAVRYLLSHADFGEASSLTFEEQTTDAAEWLKDLLKESTK